MARPTRKGLTYFPLDVDLWEDMKVMTAAERLDPTGTNPHVRHFCGYLIVRLFAEIFKEGYWMKWDQYSCAVFARKVDSTSTIVQNALDIFIECDLFNADMYDNFGILTSRGIQERWQMAAKKANRKNCDITEYTLMSGEFPHQETQVSGEETLAGRQETPAGTVESTQRHLLSLSNNEGIGNKGIEYTVRKTNIIEREVNLRQETPVSSPRNSVSSGRNPSNSGRNGNNFGGNTEETPISSEETVVSSPRNPGLLGGNSKKRATGVFETTEQIAEFAWSKTGCQFSEKFRDAWLSLVKLPNWDGRNATALEIALTQLMEYDEEFAMELVRSAIVAGWNRVIFAETNQHYEEWKKAKYATLNGSGKSNISNGLGGANAQSALAKIMLRDSLPGEC